MAMQIAVQMNGGRVLRGMMQGMVAAALLSLLSACGPFVRSDYDTKANLASYRTFSFAPRNMDLGPGERAFANPINEKRLRDAVAAKLTEEGMQPAAEGATGDAVVNVAIGERRYDVDTRPHWSFGLGTGWGWGRRGYYGSSVGILADDDILYRENRVSVDLFDAKTHEPIWHAAIDTDVSDLTGDNAQMRINAAVNSMFAKFPRK